MEHNGCRGWNHFVPQVQDALSDQRAPNKESDLDERGLGTPVVTG